VLSSGNSVIISLVHLARLPLKDCCWDYMLTETHTLADGSQFQQSLGIRLNAVIRSLVSQYNIYLVKITNSIMHLQLMKLLIPDYLEH
jgi:hypothetical protein